LIDFSFYIKNKVYFTNKQFINHVLSVKCSANEIITQLEVVILLVKKYGKLVYTDQYLTLIEEVVPDSTAMLIALKRANKLKVGLIRDIISLVKKYSNNYYKEFVVKTDTENHYQMVKSFLDGKFEGSKVDKHTTHGSGVRISWEGWYYKRWLEQDIKKILGV